MTSTTSGSSSTSGTTIPRGAGISVTQTLFDGLRTTNNIRSAESNVFASRETLRNVEQSVLQSGAQNYMDVLRDTAILDLRNSNIKVLEEQLRQTQDRFKVGEVTRTDVAQAEASVAGARADYFAAQSQLQNSIASYRQVIGEQPTRLEPARPLDRGIPPTLENAIAVAMVEHPSVQSALHTVDVSALQVKIAEGQLYPTLSLNGSAQQRYDVSNVPGSSAFVGSIVASLNVPIYEGGASYAQIRQAKEQLGTAEFQVDVSRDNVRAAVISAWGLLVSVEGGRPGRSGAGQRGRDRAERHARGSAGRPAHDARRSQRPADAAQRARPARRCPARPRGGHLRHPGLLRAAVGLGPEPASAALQSDRPLRPGEGQVVRPAHARRALTGLRQPFDTFSRNLGPA